MALLYITLPFQTANRKSACGEILSYIFPWCRLFFFLVKTIFPMLQVFPPLAMHHLCITFTVIFLWWMQMQPFANKCIFQCANFHQFHQQKILIIAALCTAHLESVYGVMVSSWSHGQCSARDWEWWGLLEENPQSGCTEICASLKGPL